MIKRIDDLVNEFSGADKKDGNGGLDIVSMIGNVDLKQIVRSVSIFDSSDGTVTLNLKAFGMTVSVKRKRRIDVGNYSRRTTKQNFGNQTDRKAKLFRVPV